MRNIRLVILTLLIASCGGGGGSVPTTPPPSVTISASESSVFVDDEFSLTWSSTDALSCSASGDWSSSIGTSGTQSLSEPDAGDKIYTITCSGAGGSDSDSVTVTVTINAPVSSSAFTGYAIDGYISGANIFIDQNYNFKNDSGEFTAVTDSNGEFLIETNDDVLFECLKNRPIVADVPVGAVDST
nr:hypothetical protein [Porticoccaceae bacterium]